MRKSLAVFVVTGVTTLGVTLSGCAQIRAIMPQPDQQQTGQQAQGLSIPRIPTFGLERLTNRAQPPIQPTTLDQPRAVRKVAVAVPALPEPLPQAPVTPPPSIVAAPVAPGGFQTAGTAPIAPVQQVAVQQITAQPVALQPVTAPQVVPVSSGGGGGGALQALQSQHNLN